MSAYGKIQHTRKPILPSTFWLHRLKENNDGHTITLHHITLETSRVHSGLLEYLSSIFTKEVEDGKTYPQEEIPNQEAFESYFFAADVLIAIRSRDEGMATVDRHGTSIEDGTETTLTIDDARKGASWDDCIAGYYYVKPNYPGRSSHICNAGFVVPPRHRGKGYGSLLAKSYLHYGPKLGYQASVFNLVFTNNMASIRLWERLGFTKAGCIPQAGRMRTDGGKEEYLDAWVFYKSFATE